MSRKKTKPKKATERRSAGATKGKPRKPAAARAKQGELNPSQWAYVSARLKGMSPYNALVAAGYNPGNRRSGQAMASRIEGRLSSRPEILAAIESAGMTPELVADMVVDTLMQGEPRDRASILKAVGKWAGWERVGVQIDEPLAGIPYEERESLLAELRNQAQRRGAARGDRDPGGGQEQ